MGLLQELRREDCERLLRGGVVGRVAFVVDGEPHIVPVNYSVVGDSVVVATTSYGLLAEHARDTLWAFEVDGFDHADQRGWSVVARGRAHAVTDDAERARIRSAWPPRAWADGPRSTYLAMPWTHLTGRKIGTGWDPARSAPTWRSATGT